MSNVCSKTRLSALWTRVSAPFRQSENDTSGTSVPHWDTPEMVWVDTAQAARYKGLETQKASDQYRSFDEKAQHHANGDRRW